MKGKEKHVVCKELEQLACICLLSQKGEPQISPVFLLLSLSNAHTHTHTHPPNKHILDYHAYNS
jgi:hypothetical protein